LERRAERKWLDKEVQSFIGRLDAKVEKAEETKQPIKVSDHKVTINWRVGTVDCLFLAAKSFLPFNQNVEIFLALI